MGTALKGRVKRRDRKNLKFLDRARASAKRHFYTQPWKVSHACCVGTAHLETCSPCQDQVDSKTYSNGLIVAALSDGAGSASFSHYGAYIVVQQAMDLVAEHFHEAFGGGKRKTAFKTHLIASLRRVLYETAKVGINLTEQERIANSKPHRSEALLVPCSARQLACTLLLVAIKNNDYIILHIGDGVIGAEAIEARRKHLLVMSGPSNGEFANETYFITSPDAENKAQIITGKLNNSLRRITGFILMSDGPEIALFDKSSNALAPACSKLFYANQKLDSKTMNDQLHSTIKTVIQHKTGDDCSLAIISTS